MTPLLPLRARRPALEAPAGAVALMATLLVVSLGAWGGGTHRVFFAPKLVATYATALSALAVLLTRRSLRWPGLPASAWTGAAFAALALLSLHASAPEAAWVELSVLASGALVLFAAAQLDRRERRLLQLALVIAAAAQLAIALLQAFSVHGLLPAALEPRQDRAAFGSVGNPEFLATLLGVGAVMAIGLLPRAPVATFRRRAALVVVALVVGLVAARNKGGLALVGAWALWQGLARWPRIRPFALAALLLLALGGVAVVAPDSVRGRALLWLASAQVISEHPWLGAGAGQFQNAYLPAVRTLFVEHPALASLLGPHTAQVDDAHALLLHGWATLGLPGLLSAAGLLWLSLRAGRRAGVLGWALAWLAAKSLYTVVLGSLSGTILWALALGLAPWRWRRARTGGGHRGSIALAAGLLLLPAHAGVRLALADRAYRRALVAQAEGEDDRALAEFEAAARWQPSFAEAHLGKAYVRFRRGERERMQAELETALRLSRTMDVIKISAHMRFYSHLYAEALPLYAFLHEVFPEHLTSMAKLALLRLETGDPEGARAMARKLLATRPRHGNFSDAENREIARRILEEP